MCRDRGWKGGVVGAWCLSWPIRRICQEDKHKAPAQPLHPPCPYGTEIPFRINLPISDPQITGRGCAPGA